MLLHGYVFYSKDRMKETRYKNQEWIHWFEVVDQPFLILTVHWNLNMSQLQSNRILDQHFNSHYLFIFKCTQCHNSKNGIANLHWQFNGPECRRCYPTYGKTLTFNWDLHLIRCIFFIVLFRDFFQAWVNTWVYTGDSFQASLGGKTGWTILMSQYRKESRGLLKQEKLRMTWVSHLRRFFAMLAVTTYTVCVKISGEPHTIHIKLGYMLLELRQNINDIIILTYIHLIKSETEVAICTNHMV